MPRKRLYGTVPRDLPNNDRLFHASGEAARLYLLLYSQADDFGNGESEPVKLSRTLFVAAPDGYPPASADRVRQNLTELHNLNLILLYQGPDGRQYFHIVDHVPSGSSTRFARVPAPTKSQLADAPVAIHLDGDLFNVSKVIPASMGAADEGGQESGKNRATIGQEKKTTGAPIPNPKPEPDTEPDTEPEPRTAAPTRPSDSSPARPSSASAFGGRADPERNEAMAEFARELCGPLKIRPPATVPHGSAGKKQAQADWTDLTKNIVPAIFDAIESGIIDAHITALREAQKSKTARKPIAVFRRRMEGLGFFKARAKVPA